MNYKLYQILAGIFSIYFFYASYKGLPSLLSNYVRYFGFKKSTVTLDRVYNGFIEVFLIVLIFVLEIKSRSLT